MKRTAIRTTAIATTVSLIGGGLTLVGLRVAHHLIGHHTVRVPVTVALPGAAAKPASLVVGLRSEPITGSGDAVNVNADAAGLLSAVDDHGDLLGQSIVTRDPLLKPTAASVTYASTADALVLQTPSLVTTSPLLAELTKAEADRSPAVAHLAGILHTEASINRYYLTYPSSQVLTALSAAAADVAARVSADIPPQPGLRPAASARPIVAGPPGPTAHTAQPSPRTATSPTTTSPTSGGPPAPRVLRDAIILADSTGTSACSSHRVADGLCLEHTYPLTLSSPELAATDWTAGWQFLYRTDQLTDSVTLPLAMLPPITNAPPTIAGAVTTAAVTGINDLLNIGSCRAFQSSLTEPCDKPNYLDKLKTALLKQLTLAGTNDAVYLPLTSQLEQARLSTIGLGARPTSGASRTELVAWASSIAFSALTEFIFPVIGLILNQRGTPEHGTQEANGGADEHVVNNPDEPAAQETQATTDTASTNAHDAATQADQSAAAAAQAEQVVAADEKAASSAQAILDQKAQTLARDRATLTQVQAAYQAGTATLHDVSVASGRVGGDTKAYNAAQQTVIDAQSKVAQSKPAAEEAQRHAAYDRQTSDAAAEQAKSAGRAAELAAQKAGDASAIATNHRSFLDEALSNLFQIALTYPAQIGRAYDAMTVGDTHAAMEDLKPLLAQSAESANRLIYLFVGAAENLVVGSLVSTLLYSIPGVGLFIWGIDFISGAVGVIQDIVNLKETAGLPDRRDFAPITANHRHGTSATHLGVLFVGAANKADLLALATSGGKQGPFVAPATPVCADTVIEPQTSVAGRHVALLNVSNIADLHLAGGLGGIAATTSISTLGGAINFAVVHSRTPLGAGPASFGAAPGHGDVVRVYEGSGLKPSDYHSFVGKVAEVIPHRSELVFEISPSPPTVLSSSPKDVGGFVFATTGQNDDELIGLAEVENGGKLVALTGLGVAQVVDGQAVCSAG